MPQPIRPVMVVTLDGSGWRAAREDDAVRRARILTVAGPGQTCTHAALDASGRIAGQPGGRRGPTTAC